MKADLAPELLVPKPALGVETSVELDALLLHDARPQ